MEDSVGLTFFRRVLNQNEFEALLKSFEEFFKNKEKFGAHQDDWGKFYPSKNHEESNRAYELLRKIEKPFITDHSIKDFSIEPCFDITGVGLMRRIQGIERAL